MSDPNPGTVVPATGPLSPDEREWMRLYERGLAARAKVEDELLRAARGADPMPDAAKLREWAQRLGVPAEYRQPARQAPLCDCLNECGDDPKRKERRCRVDHA